MSVIDSVKKVGFRTIYSYLDKDPDANIPKIMDWVDKFAGDGPNSFPSQRAVFRSVIEDHNNNWYRLIKSMWSDIDDDVRRTFFENFSSTATSSAGRSRRRTPEVRLQHPLGPSCWTPPPPATCTAPAAGPRSTATS